MGNRGRFVKYGETRRLERLRSCGIPDHPLKNPLYGPFRNQQSQYGSPAPETSATLRTARDSDISFIKRLSGEVFNKYGPYEEILPGWFRADMTVTVLAVIGKIPAGFAMIEGCSIRHDTGRVSELLAIAVEPLNQRSGIGTLLIREIERIVFELNIIRIQLHTDNENLPAITLFERNGYRPCEIKRRFYPAGQDAIVMFKEASRFL